MAKSVFHPNIWLYGHWSLFILIQLFYSSLRVPITSVFAQTKCSACTAGMAERLQHWSNHLKRTLIWQLLVLGKYTALAMNDTMFWTDQGQSGQTSSAGPTAANELIKFDMQPRVGCTKIIYLNFKQ